MSTPAQDAAPTVETVEVKVPPLPESVADATVGPWHKQVGDWVERDENLVDLETDKVVLEVPAPRSGRLVAILHRQGETVPAGAVLARLDPGGAPPGDRPARSGTGPGARAAAAPPAGRPEAAGPQAAPPGQASSPGAPPMGPAVRRLLEEHGLEPDRIPATGPGGRLLKEDVLRHLEGASAAPRPEQRVPMSRLRARIAERLVQAQREAAMLTTFNEVDMSAVQALRRRHGAAFEERHGVRLGLMSFFVRAVVEALRRFPVLNASVDGTDVIYHGYYDVGVAVATPRGLVVPVIRDADRRSFAELERAIRDFAARAREGRLALEELQGGTFTITNGGVFGSLLSTPILNPPQTGILGMHRIQDRPVAVEGEVRIRPMMYLALTYDHRLVDGADAVQFLVAVKEALEDPARLLLEL